MLLHSTNSSFNNCLERVEVLTKNIDRTKCFHRAKAFTSADALIFSKMMFHSFGAQSEKPYGLKYLRRTNQQKRNI